MGVSNAFRALQFSPNICLKKKHGGCMLQLVRRPTAGSFLTFHPMRMFNPSGRALNSANRNLRVNASSGNRRHGVITVSKPRWTVSRPTRSDEPLPLPQTPSEALISALEYRGYRIELGKGPSHKADLSWTDPLGINRRGTDPKTTSRTRGPKSVGLPVRLGYASIVAKYLRDIEPFLSAQSVSRLGERERDEDLTTRIGRVFNRKVLNYLSKKGYSVEDVASWAWILAAEDTYVSVMRYSEIEKSSREKPIPSFVLLFTLRRAHIPPRALRHLFDMAYRMLRGTSGGQEGEMIGNPTDMPIWTKRGEPHTPMILFVRLLRAIRRNAHAALPRVADMFVWNFSSAAIAELPEPTKQNHRIHLTVIYNTFLSLLAFPFKANPYQTAALQHRAAFCLLEEMAKFDPPLVVQRKGYQALIRIEIARGKTTAEQEWGILKSPSWPPWKQDRLGIDAERGKEGQFSLAMKVSHHMQTAGYSLGSWEKAAAVVAGWDTDGTPTVQTRTIIPPAGPFRDDADTKGDTSIWAARIRATRTLREAWACFLAYKESNVPFHNHIYAEMVMKFVYAPVPFQLPTSTLPPFVRPIPGDGREVFAEPSSPFDIVHVPREPPSLNEFMQDFFPHSRRITISLLCTLLGATDSFETGLQFILRSRLSRAQINALIHVQSAPTDRKPISEIDSRLFTAFIKFLCRLHRPPAKPDPAYWERTFPVAFLPGVTLYKSHSLVVTPEQALPHATFLTRLRMPSSSKSWTQFIRGILQPQITVRNPMISTTLKQVIAWKEVLEVVRWMNGSHATLEMEALQPMCTGFTSVLRMITRDIETVEDSLRRVPLRNQAAWFQTHEPLPAMMQRSLAFLKTKFYQLAPLQTDRNAVSLAGPSPSHLHAFIRVLGFARDPEGLLVLLRQMRNSEVHLEVITEGSVNGHVRLRTCVTAMRVFLEVGLLRPAERCQPQGERGEYSDPRLREAFELIRGSELFAPWPTNAEMVRYTGRSGNIEVGADWLFGRN